MIDQSISIRLNGEQRCLQHPLSLNELLEELGIDKRLVAAAHNGEVVKRERYDEIRLQDGDQVEVVRMVGGG